ncbi:MAG: hypothetical protein PHQ59_00690 [Candidatus Daviesbacteria bacterium]|nr:hypothetical protein [Candidatus Daviesbacteria bacterium]
MSTKDWFKRDINTIKNSFIYTLKKLHMITLFALVFSGILTYLYNDFSINKIIAYTIIFLPISFIGFFMVHVIETKGYDIDTP